MRSTLYALWALSRPRLVPYVLCLLAVGMAWAHWDRALFLRNFSDLLVLSVGWIALHAGTLWLNAALDQDEGEVLFGEPVPLPPSLSAYGYAALLLGVIISVQAGWIAGGCNAACAILAVLYSHPATVWKGHPIGGPLVNGVGYGLLSPMAGWSLAQVPPNPRTLIAWGLGMLGILSCYFAAQAFQHDEDAARGYRTLVVTHGSAGALLAARICLGLAYFFGMGMAAIGWFPRICLLAAPLWWWIDRGLLRWAQKPDGGAEADARQFAQRVLIAVLVVLALVFGEYLRASLAREPVAGLGTVAGHPADRPRLSSRGMLKWEERTGKVLLTDPQTR
ncbi:MAG: UbiA family prenyltransferase [Myxococcota bacterium]